MTRLALTSTRLALVGVAAAVAIFLVLAVIFPRSVQWEAISFAGAVGAAVLGLALFSGRLSSALHLSIIASLAALATASRVLFASLPNFKPVTFLVLASGVALGSQAGFMVGAFTALVSNFFFGQGPWTPWQMFAWGAIGIVGGLMGRSKRLDNRFVLAIAGAILSVAFDWFVSLYMFVSFTAHTWTALLALYLQGLPFDATHAFASALFAILFGPQMVKILRRFARRTSVEFVGAEQVALDLESREETV